jgi:hypothetical protein
MGPVAVWWKHPAILKISAAKSAAKDVLENWAVRVRPL